MKVDKADILVGGRSIGSGPALHLAAKYSPQSLILISPIKSVNDVARLIAGRITDMLVDERFPNMTKAKEVKCPTIIVHGLDDQMVPFKDSIEMTKTGFSNCHAHLFLRDKMTHNAFDYEFDLIKPISYFLSYHQENEQKGNSKEF